jgi:hypothetical protein
MIGARYRFKNSAGSALNIVDYTISKLPNPRSTLAAICDRQDLAPPGIVVVTQVYSCCHYAFVVGNQKSHDIAIGLKAVGPEPSTTPAESASRIRTKWVWEGSAGVTKLSRAVTVASDPAVKYHPLFVLSSLEDLRGGPTSASRTTLDNPEDEPPLPPFPLPWVGLDDEGYDAEPFDYVSRSSACSMDADADIIASDCPS